MTLTPIDSTGINQLLTRLEAGTPVVVPLPSPLPYVVVGTVAASVNRAKGRPGSQPVGIGIRSITPLEPALALDSATVALATWLCHVEGVGVLLPVHDVAPDWLGPATTAGMAFLGGVWLPGLDEILAGRTHLYMSSGNTTGAAPAVTAADAEAAFGRSLLVADGDHLRDPFVAHGSSTMLTVRPGLRLTVHRAGINNIGFGDDHGRYVDDLLVRWPGAPPDVAP